jgi:hypothetical protein
MKHRLKQRGKATSESGEEDELDDSDPERVDRRRRRLVVACPICGLKLQHRSKRVHLTSQRHRVWWESTDDDMRRQHYWWEPKEQRLEPANVLAGTEDISISGIGSQKSMGGPGPVLLQRDPTPCLALPKDDVSAEAFLTEPPAVVYPDDALSSHEELRSDSPYFVFPDWMHSESDEDDATT